MRAKSLKVSFILGACIINLAIFSLSLRFAYASYENMGYIIRGSVAEQTAAAAESVRIRLETLFTERLNDMKVLADRIREEEDEAQGLKRFTRDASVMARHEIVYDSIQFLDSSSIVRTLAPSHERLDLLGFDMKTLPGSLESHRYVQESARPLLSLPLTLRADVPGIVLFYPVFLNPEEGSGFIGILSASLRSDFVVSQAVRQDELPKYAIEIRFADQILYSSKALIEEQDRPRLQSFLWSTGARRNFPILGRPWEVKIELRSVAGYDAILKGNLQRLQAQVALYFLITLFLCTAIWALVRSQESRRRFMLSEERLDLAIQGAGLGLWDWDLRTGKLVVNQSYAQMLGYDLKELNPTNIDTWLEMLHPEDRDEVWSRLLRHFQGLDPLFEEELRIRSKGGQWVWVLGKGRVVEKDEEDNPLRAAGTHLDISGRKGMEASLRNSLQEKEVLLQEVNHRVKNNLQILISLLNLQSGELENEDSRQALDEWRNRVHVMSLIHEKLNLERGSEYIDAADYLRSLVEWVFVSYNRTNQVSMDVQVRDLRLHLDTAIPLGLILNELVSNALKYGFPEGRGGTVWVSLFELPQQMFRLEVRDDGVGPPEYFDLQTASSLGFVLVLSLAAQLKGVVETKIPEDGGFLISLDFSGADIKKDRGSLSRAKG